MVRFACLRSVVVFLIAMGSLAVPAAAQEAVMPLRQAAELDARPLTRASEPAASPAASPRRPGVLVPLYVSFGTLQALDTHSTSRALARGAVEANPLMKGVARNEIAMVAVKAAGTAGVLYVSEKMWKKNKAAAVVFMIATNSAMVWVVQHNYRAVR